jgi:hypothetical protein
MSFIESYERQLVEAAERRRSRRSRWLGGRQRRGLAVAIAALVVAVPATAATVTEWDPFDDPGRSERIGKPTRSQRPVDPALASQLGVLRRSQTPADRGAATSRRLRDAGERYRGAQLDGVRLLYSDREAILVPFEEPPVPVSSGGDPVVCVFEANADGFGSAGCHDAQKIERGLAIGSGSGEVSGLVPDGVARVRLIRGDETAEAAVKNNYFHAEGASSPSVVEWLADDGSLVKRIDLNAERAR